MKRYFYLLLALCIGAVAMTSCKSKGNPSEPVKYQVIAKLQSNDISKDRKALESYNKILATMKADGFEAGVKVEITTNDKAKMIADLKNFGQKVKNDVGSVTGYFTIELCGIEAQYADLNDRNHPGELYDIVEIGERIGDDDDCDEELFSWYKNDYYDDYYYVDAWVYGIKTLSYWDGVNRSDTHAYEAHIDLNKGCGASSAYIFPVMITDGNGGWNPQSPYITDVIVIYGGGQPESIVIDGRTYRQEVSEDLNKDAHGAYIYLYATRDYYDGRYLWLGGEGHDDSGNLSTRVLYFGTDDPKNFSAAKHLNDPWNANGYDVVERVVQAYDTNGNYVDEAEFNHGAGGAFIKMICAYRKHD